MKAGVSAVPFTTIFESLYPVQEGGDGKRKKKPME